MPDSPFSVTPDIAPAPLVPLPPLWVNELVGGAMEVPPSGAVICSSAGSFSQFGTSIEGASRLSSDALQARVTAAYLAIGEAVAMRRLHPIRFWNFVPAPGDQMGAGLDRYMVFNAGRYAAYARWYGTLRAFNHALATASAVGVQQDDLAIYCLASRTPGIPIENPRQRPSWQYSPRYGPKPPCFARATVVSHRRARWVLIGGTASIVGEDSKHAGDPARQFEETMSNLSAVIAAAQPARRPSRPCGSRSDLDRLRDVRVYVARAEDAALIRRLAVGRCRGVRRLEITLSRICRPELLVEIEGLAILE